MNFDELKTKTTRRNIAILILFTLSLVSLWWYEIRNSRVARDETTEEEIAGKDETIGWKIYSHSKVNFTFRYPNDWEVKSEDFALGKSPGQEPEEREVEALRVVFGRIGDDNGNNFIIYDDLQRFSCSQGKTCIDKFQISTLDAEILNILYKMVKSKTKI